MYDAHSLFYYVNYYIAPIFSFNTWTEIEMTLGVLLLIICLYTRAYDSRFASANNGVRGFLKIKTIQFGLYLQMLVCLFSIVDGYQMVFHNQEPHIVLMVFLFSSILIKCDALICLVLPTLETIKRFVLFLRWD